MYLLRQLKQGFNVEENEEDSVELIKIAEQRQRLKDVTCYRVTNVYKYVVSFYIAVC